MYISSLSLISSFREAYPVISSLVHSSMVKIIHLGKSRKTLCKQAKDFCNCLLFIGSDIKVEIDSALYFLQRDMGHLGR